MHDQTARSAQGGSQFDNGGNSLNPIYLPRGAVTVLLRPFPWETDSPLQLISSLESALLGALIVIRLRSVRLSVSRARTRPPKSSPPPASTCTAARSRISIACAAGPPPAMG